MWPSKDEQWLYDVIPMLLKYPRAEWPNRLKEYEDRMSRLPAAMFRPTCLTPS